jgi:hypothetical protein
MIQEEWDTETILHSASRKETNIIQTEPFLSLSCKLLRVEKDIISNIVLKPESIFQRISNGFTVNPINMIGNSIGNSIDGVIKVVSYAPQVVSYANLKISHSELSIPDCSDPEFVQLIQLLQDPKSLPLCLQIEKYVAQLANVSSPVGNSKMDAISKCLHAFLGDFQNRLESLEWVSKELIADYVDGLESYLIALHYPKIIHRNLQYDTEVDLQFSRRLSALHLFHYKLDSGINIEPIILQKCFALLMEFEQASTVLRKLNVLTIFFTILSDHSKAQNVDGDQFLSLIITVLVETKPPRISSNIEFCSKLRYPKHVHGKHAYCIVTIQAAILFINEIELESIDVPTSLIQFIQPEKSKQLMKKVTHEKYISNELYYWYNLDKLQQPCFPKYCGIIQNQFQKQPVYKNGRNRYIKYDYLFINEKGFRTGTNPITKVP